MTVLLFIVIGAGLSVLMASLLLRRRWQPKREIVNQLLLPKGNFSVPKGWPCAGKRGMGGHA